MQVACSVTPKQASSRLAMDGSMEYALFSLLDSMKVGKVSAPIPYRTEDGKKCDADSFISKSKIPIRIQPITNWTSKKLQTIVLANKKNVAIDNWFKKIS